MKDETKMDASRLITEVYKRPALWNQRHLSYHNRDVTNRIWMEIAAIFKLPKQVLKSKWKGLRDTFRAEIKKEHVYRKSKYTSNRPAWIHFKTLQFLKEQMVPRPPIWERNDGDNVVVTSEDSCCAIDVPNEDTTNNSITHDGVVVVQNHRQSWINASKDISEKISSQYHEIVDDDDDDDSGTRGANEKVMIRVTTIPVKNSDTSLIASNNDSNNHHIDDTIIKLEPDDNYDDNSDEFIKNVQEEMNNVSDNRGSMLKKITTEHVIMGESLGDDCVNGGNSQQQDPLEVNRFDDNYYFFMSLLPHIRTLPAERRMLLRMQIQQLVYQEVYNKTTPSSSPLLTCLSHQRLP